MIIFKCYFSREHIALHYNLNSLRHWKSCLKENLISNYSQYCLRCNRPTLTALVGLTEKLLSSLDAEFQLL